MAPDQIEQEIDELKRRVERLEAKERDRMAERLEEAFQKALKAPDANWPTGHPYDGLAGNDY